MDSTAFLADFSEQVERSCQEFLASAHGKETLILLAVRQFPQLQGKVLQLIEEFNADPR